MIQKEVVFLQPIFENISMLRRKFTTEISRFLKEENKKILLVNGARQIGKSYLIRYVCRQMFPHYIEINLQEDKDGSQTFSSVHSVQDFYVQLGIMAGTNLGDYSDTIIFLDEIQVYPHLLALLKFLNQDGRYRYIASGSQLGMALKMTTSTPMGSVAVKQMYPLDFEEFLWAMGANEEAIEAMRERFTLRQPLNGSLHEYMMRMFRFYLIVGGMPEAVNQFVKDQNIALVRSIQEDIINLYRVDVSQYDEERKLKIRTIYDLIPSLMENKKKRVVYRDIEQNRNKRYEHYEEEFDYLTASGVALDVRAISNPNFPLKESQQKNLLKLYLNDVGLLTLQLYGINVNAILNDVRSINLGTVYESAVAQELHAHGYPLFYYDNKKLGGVDFLVDDYNSLSVLPIEVKSGKDYYVHSALDKFVKNKDYSVEEAVILCNQREVQTDKNGCTYLPVYYSMFLRREDDSTDTVLTIPEMPD